VLKGESSPEKKTIPRNIKVICCGAISKRGKVNLKYVEDKFNKYLDILEKIFN